MSLIERGRITGVKIGSLALHELELNLKAGNILVERRKAALRDMVEFFTDLSRLLSIYNIEIFPLSCEQIARAADLRERYKLTFYDSHHASSAMLYDSEIISNDTAYDGIKDLTRIDPYTMKER